MNYKVLLIGPLPPPVGGQSILVKDIADHLPIEMVTVFNISHTIKNRLLRSFYSVLLIFKCLLYMPFHQTVHIHSSAGMALYEKLVFALLSKIFFKRVILHVHGGKMRSLWSVYSPIKKKLLRSSINFLCDDVIVLSAEWQRFYIHEVGVDCRIHVLPNAVSFDAEYTPEVNSEVRAITFIGLVTEAKGVYELVRSLCDKKYSGLRLNLVGPVDHSVKQALESILSEDCAISVSMPGAVMGEAKWDVLKMTDIFVLPSHSEDLPISIIEAICMGLPVVATSVGSVPDLVENDVNGYLVPARDELALKNALDKLIENYEIRQRMSINNLNRRQMFSFDKYLSALITIYIQKS